MNWASLQKVKMQVPGEYGTPSSAGVCAFYLTVFHAPTLHLWVFYAILVINYVIFLCKWNYLYSFSSLLHME